MVGGAALRWRPGSERGVGVGDGSGGGRGRLAAPISLIPGIILSSFLSGIEGGGVGGGGGGNVADFFYGLRFQPFFTTAPIFLGHTDD